MLEIFRWKHLFDKGIVRVMSVKLQFQSNAKKQLSALRRLTKN